ncbi:MAG: hypothetical protein RIS76_4254 [Verrucomicrobiota bacterium]
MFNDIYSSPSDLEWVAGVREVPSRRAAESAPPLPQSVPAPRLWLIYRRYHEALILAPMDINIALGVTDTENGALATGADGLTRTNHPSFASFISPRNVGTKVDANGCLSDWVGYGEAPLYPLQSWLFLHALMAARSPIPAPATIPSDSGRAAEVPAHKVGRNAISAWLPSFDHSSPSTRGHPAAACGRVATSSLWP